MLRMALILTASIIAVPALAQTAPPNMHPTRDVTVSYRSSGPAAPAMPGGAGSQEIRMAWSVADQKQRVDPPGGMGWMLIDRKANSAVMVMEAQRMIMTMPPEASAAMTQEVPADARFSRKGTVQIAGQSCTEWDIASAAANSTVCLTDDGVLLRVATQMPNNGGTAGLEATEVRYAAHERARFTVPQGYQQMQMPGAPPTR